MYKIKLPTFESFKSRFEHHSLESSKFPFHAEIVTDIVNDKICMYGFISTTKYYDDAIVVSNDFVLNGRISDKEVYKKVVKQLQTKYARWVNTYIIQK